MLKRPIPIFIVGVQRSGTTWLANVISNHSKIAAIQDEKHLGIHESAFFSIVANSYGDLRDDNEFIKFVGMFSKSDYFIISRINEDLIFKKRPYTYYEFFKVLMDSYAEKENASYWLEKTPAHSLYLEELSEHFPKAKFIAIKRNITDTIKSIIKRKGHHGFIEKRLKILRFIYHYLKYYKHIEYFAKKNPGSIKIIKYENLRKSKKKTIKDLCVFLGIKYEDKMLLDKYRMNTSFKYEEERKKFLAYPDKWWIRFIFWLFNLFPYHFFRLAYMVERIFKKKKLPGWFYSIIKEKKLGRIE